MEENKVENKEKTPYRNLEDVEVHTLFSFYDKHNGNVLEMTKDKDIPFKAKSQIYYYRDLYDFITKLSKIKTERAEQFKKEWSKRLKEGKMKAIEKAIELLDKKTYNRVDKNNDIVEITSYPDGRDIKTAYEILKVELGEPTTISRNTNIEENDEVKQTIEGVKQLIKEGQKKDEPQTDTKNVQSGGKTSSDSTKVPTSV